MIVQYFLNVARDKEAEIATLANPVEQVSVARWALNQSGLATIHFGHGDPGHLITQEGQVWGFDPPHREGVFITTTGAGIGAMQLDYQFRTFQTPRPVVDVTRARTAGPARAWLDQLKRNFGL